MATKYFCDRKACGKEVPEERHLMDIRLARFARDGDVLTQLFPQDEKRYELCPDCVRLLHDTIANLLEEPKVVNHPKK